MNVHYLGPPNTFSERAAAALAPGRKLVPEASLEAVADAVAEDRVGVLPYYNFLEGLIQESLDLMVEYRLQIVDACRLPIAFALGGWPQEPAVIYSHPKALAQCSDFLREHYADAQLKAVASTADATALVAREKSGCALAGELALQNDGLPVIARDVANQRHGKSNFTEFLLLTPASAPSATVPADAAMRTMIAIAPDFDEPGLLALILGQVAFHRINVAKIHSRPLFLENAGEGEPQMFYLEVEGALTSPALQSCVDALRHRFGKTGAVRLLGQFPQLRS